MLKVRIPYSGIAVLLVYAFPPHIYWLALLAGIVVEITIAIILFRKLTSFNEFDYDSLVGQLLLQYTLLPEVGLMSLLNLIGARVACYAIILIMMAKEAFGSIWFFIPIIIYILTIVHYVPKGKTPLS